MNPKQLLKLPIIWLLKQAAIYKLKRINPQIVGVTGSLGKSSFIYMLDAVTKGHFKTKTTFKGNSETGLPLEILNLRSKLESNNLVDWSSILFNLPSQVFANKDDFELLIAEMGVDGPDEPVNMSYLLKIIQPKIGVLLSIAPTHTEQFSAGLPEDQKNDKEAILKLISEEKGKLVTSLPADGVAIINTDSPYIKKLIPDIKAKVVSFGENKMADFQLIKHTISDNGTSFEIKFEDQNLKLNFKNYFLLREYGLITCAVLATANELKIPLSEVIKFLEENTYFPPGRVSLIEGQNESTIIDSSYNSSPIAVEAMLTMLKQIKVKGKKIAILGDMRELGPLAESEHIKLADFIIKNCDFVALVGPLMNQYTLKALEKLNFSKDKMVSFKTSQAVGDYLLKNVVKPHDLILVKGSQNTILLEVVVKDLMKNPDQASKLLCRQSSFWDKTRQTFFKSTPRN